MNKANQEALIEFNPKLPKLSKNEQEVLKILVEAGRLISPLYLEQERHSKKVLNKKEIEEAAEKNSSILSPYTVVEKVNGKIIAIPYHIKYAHFLKPISEKINQAASIAQNKEFKKALKMQAKALIDGNYEQATAVWLKMKPYTLDISIGPLQYHSAQLLSAKASYQAWVGVLDEEGTMRLNRYKTITLRVRRKALIAQERIDNLDHVKAKTINVVLFSGFMAKTKFVGVNLPMDVNIVQKYGSEITIFNQPNDMRMKEQILPTFQVIFPKSFREGFNSEDLRRGNLRTIAMHELAHSYLYYKNAARNLEGLFICIYELAATVLGLRMAGALHLEDVVTSKQLESMVVTYLCRNFYLMKRGKKDKFMVNHLIGGKIFVNFLLENGALMKKGELVIPNFMKIFLSLHELSYILERLLSSGTRKDAEILVEKYLK